MNETVQITPFTHCPDDAPGGGYLDDAALISFLDHELSADNHFVRSQADRAGVVAGDAA